MPAKYFRHQAVIIMDVYQKFQYSRPFITLKLILFDRICNRSTKLFMSLLLSHLRSILILVL